MDGCAPLRALARHFATAVVMTPPPTRLTLRKERVALAGLKPSYKVPYYTGPCPIRVLLAIPVLEDGKSVGSLRENHLLSKVFNDRDLLEVPVSKVMDKSFPTVDVDDDVNVVSRKLRTSPAVLIEEYGRISGIITRHDLLDVDDNGN